ncbi:hypothetical protein L6Q79_01265 [bacterium]|nr:hypothetical protein [bacterium]NUN45538.1 hypothetical protein [bacterium]HMV25268.1 hypothetical protein [bacterium]HMW32338.1 hypothetical protein [bacterium]HMW35756.1 hypothetical protein [bacterium]
METSSLFTIIAAFLSQSPIVVVWIVGAVLAYRQKPVYPRKSLLIIIAMLLFLGQLFINTILNIVFPMMWDTQQLLLSYNVKAMVTSMIMTAGWILIMMALFMKEKSRDGFGQN